VCPRAPSVPTILGQVANGVELGYKSSKWRPGGWHWCRGHLLACACSQRTGWGLVRPIGAQPVLGRSAQGDAHSANTAGVGGAPVRGSSVACGGARAQPSSVRPEPCSTAMDGGRRGRDCRMSTGGGVAGEPRRAGAGTAAECHRPGAPAVGAPCCPAAHLRARPSSRTCPPAPARKRCPWHSTPASPAAAGGRQARPVARGECAGCRRWPRCRMFDYAGALTFGPSPGRHAAHLGQLLGLHAVGGGQLLGLGGVFQGHLLVRGQRLALLRLRGGQGSGEQRRHHQRDQAPPAIPDGGRGQRVREGVSWNHALGAWGGRPPPSEPATAVSSDLSYAYDARRALLQGRSGVGGPRTARSVVLATVQEPRTHRMAAICSKMR
jgi:hypothetical protein